MFFRICVFLLAWSASLVGAAIYEGTGNSGETAISDDASGLSAAHPMSSDSAARPTNIVSPNTPSGQSAGPSAATGVVGGTGSGMTRTTVGVAPGRPAAASPQAQAPVAAVIELVQPIDQTTFPAGTDEVTAVAQVSRALEQGESIEFYLNGALVAPGAPQLSVSLGRLDRGSYQLQAKLKRDANTEAESKVITFFQQRHSHSPVTP